MAFSYLGRQFTEMQLTKLALLRGWSSDYSSGDRPSQVGLLLADHKDISYRTS